MYNANAFKIAWKIQKMRMRTQVTCTRKMRQRIGTLSSKGGQFLKGYPGGKRLKILKSGPSP